MCPTLGNNQDVNIVHLNFATSNILYDIKNYAYIEGDILQADDEHARHQVFDVCEDGNVDRVTRVLDLTMARVVELLYPYAKKEVREHSCRDNELEEEDEYVIKLQVPDSFSETTVTLLEKLIHELLVCTVLADWFSITKPSSTETWAARAATLEAEIRRAKNSRSGRLTRKMYPF